MSNENLQRWALIAEILGGIAVVFSLIFVGLEIRQTNSVTALNTRAIEVSAFNDLYNQINQTLELRVTNDQLGELVEKVFDNEELSRQETIQYRSFWRIILHHGVIAFKQYEYGFISEDELNGLLAPVRYQLTSDVGKTWWPLDSRFYSEGYVNYVKELMRDRYPEDVFWSNNGN